MQPRTPAKRLMLFVKSWEIENKFVLSLRCLEISRYLGNLELSELELPYSSVTRSFLYSVKRDTLFPTSRSDPLHI
jgi:hypothetical protein